MSSNSGKQKILVVDDEYSSRRILVNILNSHFKCSVQQAEDGSEALQMMIKESPTLVLLDLVMPFMNGVKVLQTMQQNAALKKIPVIVCTSLDDNNAVKQILKYGVRSYLVKPIKKDVAVKKITEILEVVE